jgi:hypothetical protein
VFRALLFATILGIASNWGLAADPQLAVERMALHQFEDGPLLADSYEFLPGETAYFSCRFFSYQTEALDNEQRQVKLSWKTTVFDSTGVAIEAPKQGRIESKLSKEDKDWLPKFLISFSVPSFVLPGKYRVSVEAQDEIGGNETHADLAFRVRGHELQPSETLVARNFRFLRSETDAIGTRSGLYHPGDTLWARFDITGYKFGENHRFSVECAMAVETADGTQLFSQPDAASQSGESFYPQPYVPIELNLSLDKTVRPASYTLVITLRDSIGNQTAEVRESFLLQ